MDVDIIVLPDKAGRWQGALSGTPLQDWERPWKARFAPRVEAGSPLGPAAGHEFQPVPHLGQASARPQGLVVPCSNVRAFHPVLVRNHRGKDKRFAGLFQLF